MLEGLDGIDWVTVGHAYGPADDVPRMLRDVAAGGKRADEAISELFVTICHQGTVYDASAAAVPFLGELVESDHVELELRALLLWLIFVIARGKGYWQVHADMADRLGGASPEEVADLLPDEDVIVRACRDAVEQVATRLLREMSSWPDRLWLSTAVLVVVAGSYGRARAVGIADEASVRLPRFGALGMSVIADLVTTGATAAKRVDELLSLDEELADYAENVREPSGLDVSVGSYFLDVLVERMCDTQGAGSAAGY